MKKLTLYVLALLVFISCGKTGSDDTYLKVLSTTPTNSQKDANIYDPITIKFNEEIKEVSIALIDTNEIDGQVTGDTKIVNDKVIFTPQNDLKYSIYKVNIHKIGTISSNDKKLKENYSYTFTTYPKKVNDIPKDKEEDNKTTADNTDTNQSYSTCDLIPQMNCSDIKNIETN